MGFKRLLNNGLTSNYSRLVKIIGAMGTPDGRWRFEVIRKGREQQYRMWHDGELLPYRGAMGMFERLLAEDGYGLADLIDLPTSAGDAAQTPAADARRR